MRVVDGKIEEQYQRHNAGRGWWSSLDFSKTGNTIHYSLECCSSVQVQIVCAMCKAVARYAGKLDTGLVIGMNTTQMLSG